MRKLLLLLGIICFHVGYAGQGMLKGTIVDAGTNQPLEGITVYLLPTRISTITNANGQFTFKVNELVTGISTAAIGYEGRQLSIQQLTAQHNIISLHSKAIELNTVTVANEAGRHLKPISQVDIAMRGVTNSQEVLRIIPGLFIRPHQGGG